MTQIDKRFTKKHNEFARAARRMAPMRNLSMQRARVCRVRDVSKFVASEKAARAVGARAEGASRQAHPAAPPPPPRLRAVRLLRRLRLRPFDAYSTPSSLSVAFDAFDASDDASAAPASLANPASAWGVSDACEAPPQLDDELSSA